MPYREQSAWGSLIATLVACGLYFAILAPRLMASHDRPPPYLALLFGCIVGLVVLQIVFQAGIAAAARDQAGLPADERERLIFLQSDRVAMVVLAAMIGAGWLVYVAGASFAANSTSMANLSLFALVAAALAKYASQIVYFHQGSRGYAGRQV